jgi:uncharacterized membrane protein YcfT
MEKALPDSTRTIWMDTAKGLCILLVVSWHVIWKSYLHIDWAVAPAVAAAWSVFGRALLPMRMPLFFLISGVLAASAVARPWRVVGRTKVAGFGYLYLLWLLIHSVVLPPLPIPFDTDIARTPLELLEEATILPTALWYLYALALYFVVAKLVRRAPVPLVLGVAFAVSTASSTGWIPSPGNNGTLYQNLFFFLAGLYFGPVVQETARASTWWQVAGAGAAFVVCLGVLVRFDAAQTPLVWPLTSIVATIFAVLLMSRVSRWRATNGLLTGLGRRTLPIYVLHMPLLAYAHWLLSTVVPGLPAPLRLALVVVEPLLLTAGLVWLCLAISRASVRVGAGWLYELPKPGSAAVVEPPVPETAPIPVPRREVSDRTDRLVLVGRLIPAPRTPSPDWMDQTMRMDYAIAPTGPVPR